MASAETPPPAFGDYYREIYAKGMLAGERPALWCRERGMGALRVLDDLGGQRFLSTDSLRSSSRRVAEGES